MRTLPAVLGGVVSVTLSLILSAALMASAAFAQDPAPALPIESLDASQHPDVTLTVSMPPELVGLDLRADSFTLLENGQPRPVEVTRLPNDDLQVVLLIDTSGSMDGAPIEGAKAAAVSFVQALPPGVQLAVMGFGEEPGPASGFTTDPAAALAAVDGLEVGGETALYDAVSQASQLFPDEVDARRSIVLLSDGGDTVSVNTLEQAANRLAHVAEDGTSFYAVELTSPEGDVEALRELVAAGRGQLAQASDPAALAAVYQTIASALVNRYSLAYTSQAHGAAAIDVVAGYEAVSASASREVVFPPEPPPPAAPDPVATLPALRPGTILSPGLLASPWTLVAGGVAFYAALALAILLLLAPRERTRWMTTRAQRAAVRHGGRTRLTVAAETATMLVERTLRRGNREGRLNDALERAGIALRPAESVVLVACAAVVAGLLGLSMGGPLLALVLVAATVYGAKLALSIRTDRRRSQFADQLGDTLQLLAGSLRAGYGLLQAIDSVAREAEHPTADEFHRVIVENRLGRDLQSSLQGMADRIGSDDFIWVVQAFEIHREVGGDLAEVLDTVAATIRERNQIRRQIKTLSAEGRLSAIILFVLPFAVGALISVINPGYLRVLVSDPLGYTMLGMAAVLMTVGGLWLRRIIRLVF